MNLLNISVFFVYLAIVLFIGFLCRSKNRSGLEFFLASRSMRWFPIGISLMVTMFSAANFKAFPTEVAVNGLYVMVSIPVFALSGFIVTKFFVPRYYGMQLISLYAILEQRFDIRVRRLASGMFIVWRLFWMAATLYASAVILAEITGIWWGWLVWIVGGISLVYTMYGGIRAVIWTDVMQFCVIFCGVVAATIIAARVAQGGLSGVFSSVYSSGGFRPLAPVDPEFFSFDPRVRITLWSGLLGTLVTFMARYGADQVVVQRYFTARSLGDAKAGVWCNVVASTLMLLILSVFGVFLKAAAVAAPAGAEGGLLARAVLAMPSGVSGLICAAIVAASMSSIDSGINACSAAYTEDFHPWISRVACVATSDLSNRVGFFSSMVFGILSIAAGFIIARAGDFFEMINRVVNGFGSPLLGLILLTLFSKRATAVGCLAGGIVGMAFSAFMSVFVKELALHYYAVANLAVTLIVGLVVSMLSRATRVNPA